MQPALRLDALTKRFGGHTAVDRLSFEVQPGSVFGFLGPNGAGKTSTIRMVLGLIPPTSGAVGILGASDARVVRDRLGFLPEERGLYRRMTPVDAVVFFAGLKGVAPAVARKRGIALLESQGLGEALRRPMKALSKGMAQKVQLITALVHEPELVILDEPFSGLDPVNQQSLETLIRDLAARGATVIFSTHVMAHAERLCERIVLMAKGRKVFDGATAQARAAAGRRLVLEGDLTRADVAGLPGILQVSSDAGEEGGWRHTATLAADAEVAETLKAAFQRTLPLTRFEMREPSLHDAFIVLTGGSEAAPPLSPFGLAA